MTVTLTGKIVAIMAIVAVLIIGAMYRRYKRLTDSILKEQDRQLKMYKELYDANNKWIVSLLEENKVYREKELAKKLDEKIDISKSENKSEKDINFDF